MRRTPISLRTHGSNAAVQFHGPDRVVVTTSNGTNLLYSILPAPASRTKGATNEVYALPGGDKAEEAWPKGPGEGGELEGIILQAEGVRSMSIGEGIGSCVAAGLICLKGLMLIRRWFCSVCLTDSDLLLAVQDPPSLRIVPFPAPASSATSSASRLPFGRQPPPPPRRGSGWDSLPNGLHGETASETIILTDWDWLVGRDRTNGEWPTLGTKDCLWTHDRAPSQSRSHT